MNNYLNNNIVLINMYENLYANGIRIDEIIQMFKKGEFAQYSGFDFVILSILVDTFISKISFPMQPGPEIGSISDA